MNATLLSTSPITPDAPERGRDASAAIGETVRRERGRLLAFIRRRLPDPEEAEDVLQDVFMELTEAYQLAKPIERMASWLFAVARHKISDWYRRRNRVGGAQTVLVDPMPYADDDGLALDDSIFADWLSTTDGTGPEDDFFRETLMDALTDALAELPAEQREVFVQHELEGRSFKELAAEWNVSVNTLLSRKRYAVLHLRKRLRDLYDDFLNE